jgi:Amt family ammonium transporter
MMNTVWMVIVSIMTILAQLGYLMVEIGSIKTQNNSDLLLKNLLVMAISSAVFFLIGFGISTQAEGGLMGMSHFSGLDYTYTDYSKFLFHYSLCILMASIATGPIAERTSLDTYVFFTFITSAFIFPTILAWCWEDGWLQNLGFQDYAGAGIVHLSAGIAGFVGTYLTGPRIGMYKREQSLEYLLAEENFDEIKQTVVEEKIQSP